MEESGCIFHFMKAIRDDPRIAPSHISLYLAILSFGQQHSIDSPIIVFRRDLMKQAKISGKATYIKCLHDLVELGYIEYTPSYSKYTGSLINVKRISDPG